MTYPDHGRRSTLRRQGDPELAKGSRHQGCVYLGGSGIKNFFIPLPPSLFDDVPLPAEGRISCRSVEGRVFFLVIALVGQFFFRGKKDNDVYGLHTVLSHVLRQGRNLKTDRQC